jgi:hypothetical protein
MGWSFDDLPLRYRGQVQAQLPGGKRPKQPELSEKEFQERVVFAARSLGWLVYHTYDSRRSEPGFPDLTMVRRGRLIFAEMKKNTGVCTDAQQRWLAELEQTECEVYLWRPDDYEEILEVLK